jgi:hypothetical protein
VDGAPVRAVNAEYAAASLKDVLTLHGAAREAVQEPGRRPKSAAALRASSCRDCRSRGGARPEERRTPGNVEDPSGDAGRLACA